MKTIVSICTFLLLSVFSFQKAMAQENSLKPGKDLSVALQVIDKDSIRITVKNFGKKTVAAYSHAISREDQYDYFELEVEASGKKPMTFSFYDDRPTSAPVLALLSPGESFTHTINLTEWATRTINQAALQKSGLSTLPKDVKIRAKYLSLESDSFHGFIWSGYVYSEWVGF